MGYDGRILAQATTRLAQKSARHERELDERERILEDKLPRLREINILLQRSVISAIHAALSTGNDAGHTVREQQQKNKTLREERAAILTKNGYAPDYLDRIPLCSFCGDSGYTQSGMCGCLRGIYREEQLKDLKENTGLSQCYFRDIDLSLYTNTVEDGALVSPRENMRYITHVCQEFVNTRRGRGNLFFTGAPGTGKTFLAACLANTAIDADISVVYKSAGYLLSRYEDMRFRREDDTAKSDISYYENCDLLIMDDLGTELTTSVTIAGLYQLLSARMTANRGTVIITNVNNTDLRRRYPVQILSRLEGSFETLNFFGEDIRRKKGMNFY